MDLNTTNAVERPEGLCETETRVSKKTQLPIKRGGEPRTPGKCGERRVRELRIVEKRDAT